MDDKDAQSAIDWMKETGLALMYPTGSGESLEALWQRWQGMSQDDKQKSDAKSIELFGMANEEHHDILSLLYV